MDNLKLVVKGNNLNIFQKYVRLRSSALGVALFCLGAWLIFGFDSTPLQFIHVLYEGIPSYLMGEASFNDLIRIYNSYYGKEMHYSAFVIYGLMYYVSSKHFSEKLGICKSKNVAFTCSLCFLAIATFEWFWILNYGYWQNQPWVYTWRWPQMKILLQNLAFSVAGVLGLLYIWADSYELDEKKLTTGKRFYKLNVNPFLIGLIGLTVILSIAWIYYPFALQHISVPLANGEVWTNSRHFPQTLYTVDLNPADSLNAGVWFYVQNDLVHGLNTLVKIIWSASICYMGLIKKCKLDA